MNGSTVYILTGGDDWKIPEMANRLKSEITKHVERPKILSCFFSSPESTWDAKHQAWQQWWAAVFGQDFTYASAQRATFLQQIDDADVVFLHGGDTRLLFDALQPDIDALQAHLKGKIVIGSSAGANILVANYWSSSRAVPDRGFGILDPNIMVHYGAPNHEGRIRTADDWKNEEARFRAFIGEGAITRIPEGQYVVERK